MRISLTCNEPAGAGKTSAHTETYHGHFERLVPNERAVEVDEFETEDPALRGEMSITITLADADGGTDLLGSARRTAARQVIGQQRDPLAMALAKLAAFVEVAIPSQGMGGTQ